MATRTAPSNDRETLLAGFAAAEPSARIALDIDGGTLGLTMSPRTFSTGSLGFSAQGKVIGDDGRKYQVNVNAVLVGSKPTN